MPEEKSTQHVFDHRIVGIVHHVAAFDLPLSSFLDGETRVVLERQAKEGAALAELCPQTPNLLSKPKEVIAFRECYDKHYHPRLVAKHQARYRVDIRPETIAGVYTEIFTPAEGISDANRQRVLINLHGGGFVMGARWAGRMESIPIAAVGRIKVVSVDYRQGPEHRFPAASEDVGKVYETLLRAHRPENIGIYGCSAGAVLTAQTVAWLQDKGLPRSGAVGMLAAAAGYWGEGDSGRFYAARAGSPVDEIIEPRENPYFKDLGPDESLAFPLRSPERLAKFPPSWLAASTRDLALSSVVHTHSRLVDLGVEAQLHVWEGLDHAFHYDPDLPQSRELYRRVVKFFDEHLAK